jgi:hypothetical protein
MARRIRLLKEQQRDKRKLWEDIQVSTRKTRWSEPEVESRRKAASVVGWIPNNAIQHRKIRKKEGLEFLLLPSGVFKATPDDNAFAAEPILNFGIPDNRIDIKVILMSVREDLLHRKLIFADNFLPKRVDVIIPSLKCPFKIWYQDGHVCFQKGISRAKKIPFEFEDGQIPEKVIDLLCAIIEYNKLNPEF